jgi:hypothetical protein
MKKVPFVPRSLSTIKPIASTSTPTNTIKNDSTSKAPSPAAQSILDVIFNAPRIQSTFLGASLYFSSAQEARKLPFDPFSRPKRVYKASSSGTKVQKNGKEDADWLIGLLRAQQSKQHRVRDHAKTAAEVKVEVEDGDEVIFPEAGVFDEHAALEDALQSSKSAKLEGAKTKTTTIKSKLFKTKSLPESEEVDVFKLISGDHDEDDDANTKDDSAGGLFGFSLDLPQLNRLKDTATRASSDDPYNLSDSAEKGESPEGAFEYDAGDEDELITTQADDDEETGKAGRKKRRAKEESEIRAVERIMKTKYQE